VLLDLLEKHIETTGPVIDSFPWGYTTSGSGIQGGSLLFWKNYAKRRKGLMIDFGFDYRRYYRRMIDEVESARGQCAVSSATGAPQGRLRGLARLRCRALDGSGLRLSGLGLGPGAQKMISGGAVSLVYDANRNGALDRGDKLVADPGQANFTFGTDGPLLFHEGLKVRPDQIKKSAPVENGYFSRFPDNYYDFILVSEDPAANAGNDLVRTFPDDLTLSFSHPFSNAAAEVKMTRDNTPAEFAIELESLAGLPRWRGEQLDGANADAPLSESLPPFIQPDGDKALRLVAGEHIVDSLVVIPEGYRLTIEPGSTLKITPGAGIYALGPVIARGTGEKPVRFINAEPDKSGGSFVVNYTKGEPSVFEHCVFDGTGEITVNAMRYSGSLNILGAKATIRDCQFRRIHGEDGLNVKWGDVTVADSHFEDVASDGIDFDFSAGKVENVTFLNAGNDAIDLGDSSVAITGCRIQGAGDKGISVGGRSYPVIRKCDIRSTNTGIQVKDDSQVDVSNTAIFDSKVGVHAFMKNPAKNSMTVVLNAMRYGGNGADETADKGTQWNAIQHDQRLR